MKVTVYHTTNCAFCKTEMQWLDSKGVEYTHRNIETDDSVSLDMAEITPHKAVPVTTIEKNGITTVVYGFDRVKLTEMLGLDK